MAKKFYYPPSPGNGSGTFSDNLVGLQFTQGSPQMTLGNFSITDSSREKNNRDFSFGGFSGPITLEQLSGGDIELTQVNLNNSLCIIYFTVQLVHHVHQVVQYSSMHIKCKNLLSC